MRFSVAWPHLIHHWFTVSDDRAYTGTGRLKPSMMATVQERCTHCGTTRRRHVPWLKGAR